MRSPRSPGTVFPLILAQKCPPRKTRRVLLRFLQGYLSALARKTLRGDKDEKTVNIKRRRAGVIESPAPSRQKGRNQRRRAV